MSKIQCISCLNHFDIDVVNSLNVCLKCQNRKNISLDEFMPIFCISEPFYGYLSKYVDKTYTDKIPTIGVCLDNFGRFRMKCNPEFFQELPWVQKGEVLKHEFLHIILDHLIHPKEEGIRFKRNQNQKVINWATDLSINSLLNYDNLPKFALYPGKRFEIHPKELERINKLEPSQREAELAIIKMLQDFVESLPVGECAEWYYKKIMSNEDVASTIGGSSNSIGELDEHDDWFKSLPEEQQEQIRQKVKRILKEACEKEEWGSIPHEMREKLKVYYSNKINWRSILRMFVGSCRSSDNIRTMKKINKRFPYIHSGIKIKRQSNIAIAIDQSGSVSDETLTMFFSELNNLSNYSDFTVIPFDTEVDDKSVFLWKKNQKIQPNRVRCGGTDFSIPTRWVNERRKYFDGFIILTDGYCEAPINSLIKRAYIICPDGKLMFKTSDLVIQMTK